MDENFGDMFERECQKDELHMVRWAIEKEVWEHGRIIDHAHIQEIVGKATEEILEMINKLAEEEIQYIKNKSWTRRKQRKLEEEYMWEWKKNHDILAYIIAWVEYEKLMDRIRQRIEYRRRISQALLLPEPPLYAHARDQYKTLLNLILIGIEVGSIIGDDET